jgi:hypothetical protein
VLVLAGLVVLVFGLTFLSGPTPGGGWFWDLGNGIGFLAFAGLLFQMIPVRGRAAMDAHEGLGYGVLALVLLHGFWFLAGDAAVHVYLQWGAPPHMILGLAAVLALAVLTVLARMPDRLTRHRSYRSFRDLHRTLALVVAGAAALHVVLSRFYLAGLAQALLFAALTLTMCLGRSGWDRVTLRTTAPLAGFLALGAVAVGLFAAIRTLAA